MWKQKDVVTEGRNDGGMNEARMVGDGQTLGRGLVAKPNDIERGVQ